MRGFLLGLANGTACLAFCAPILVPLFLHEGRSVRQNLFTLLQFLGGRLGGYTLLGLLAWATGGLLVQVTGYQSLMIATAYVLLAGLLLVAVLRKTSARACSLQGMRARLARWPALLPAGMGFGAGLKICPPLLLAFANAADAGTLAGSLLFFATFFLGTLIYFVPVIFVGAFRHMPALRMVGKFAAVIVALFYLYLGLLFFIGGVR
jgi:sulfite exporter TauE/SafE